MEDNINDKFELHKKWIDTVGKKGNKLILDEVDVRKLDFKDKIFNQANILDCNFDGLRLENTDFHASILCSSTFIKCNLKNCDFYKADLGYTDFTDSVIKNTRFSKSDCWETIFQNVDMNNCNFINVNFCSTDFSNARLENVDISMATFEDVIFNGVRLKMIKGIEEANFISINIGTVDEPILLKAENAKKWFEKNAD